MGISSVATNTPAGGGGGHQQINTASGGVGHHHHHHHHHPRDTGTHIGHGHITIVNQHAVLAYELTKFLKQHYKVPTVEPYDGEKLIRRTSRTCVGQYNREKWKEHFARRHDHLNKGFFTSQCEPYESIGHIELDPRNMVYGLFKKCLPRKLSLPGIGGGLRVTVSPTKGMDVGTKQKPLTPEAGELGEVDLSTAGFTFVKDYLKDTHEMLVAGKGGQPFEKCVKEIEDRKRQLAEDADTTSNAITFLPPTGLSHRDMMSRSVTPTYHHHHQSAASLTMSTESMRSTASRISSTSSPSRTKPVDSDAELEQMRLDFNRARRAILHKLDAIIMIMNALHNLKSRDLRTRVPLSHETVKYLYREIPPERTGFSRPLGTTTTAGCATTTARQLPSFQTSGASGQTETSQSADMYGSSETPVGVGGRHVSIGGWHSKLTSRSHLPTPPHRPSAASFSKPLEIPHSTTPPPMAWKKYGRVGGMMMNKLKAHHQQEKDPKLLENWDDLLAVQPSSPVNAASQQQHRLSVNPDRGTIGTMKWLQMHHRNHSELPPVVTSKQPYWLTVAVSSADKAKRTAPDRGSVNGMSKDKNDPEKTIISLKENFVKSQRKLAREIMTDLERMQRERCRTFRQKFHTCSSSPLFEKTVKHMREIAPITQVGVIDHVADIEVKPSKWYVDLKAEAEDVVGCKDDHEVLDLLNKLSRFYLEDARSIPNAKEKLCLLLMSMPASQLLTIHMQQAIQYVLNSIILGPAECFSQWLQHRNVPQIIPSIQA